MFHTTMKTVHNNQLPEEHTFFDKNEVYAYLSNIPYSDNYSTPVYFVSGKNGDEFGQFETEKAALDKALMMSKLTLEERKAYDE